MTVRTVVAISVAALCCAACQYAPTMLDRTVAYNRAVADSTNQVLLLNIVRASERLPTYYTRLESDSSSLGLTPNASLTTPLANGRSFEIDGNTGATGAVTSGATKAVTSLAALAGGLGLQASESNLLSLQTLDDQKYQNGMMTPVPLKNIQAFQDTGLQRDLLFLMFMNNIQVSKTLIGPMDAAVAARCSQVKSEPQAREAITFVQQICIYIDSGPYRSLFPNAANSFSLQTCTQTGGASTDPSPGQMVHFDNDPAREGRKGDTNDPHPEVCFQILLDDLLVLGLEVGSTQDIPADLVDTVPDAVAQDAKFRAQMFQQNFFVRETSTGITAICKKKSQDVGLTLLFADPKNLNESASAPPLDILMKDLGVTSPKTTTGSGAASAPKEAAPADPATACQQKSGGVPEQVSALGTPDNADTDSAPAAQKGAIRPVKLTSDKISFTTRSFEGMVYYLGEVVRYQEDADADQLGFPRVLGRNPVVSGSDYFENLFYASSFVADADRAVTVRDDSGVAYAIPKSCMSGALAGPKKIGCSVKYPDNESIPVLNLINQVWGLQKESNAGPGSPLVVVSPQ